MLAAPRRPSFIVSAADMEAWVDGPLYKMGPGDLAAFPEAGPVMGRAP